MKTITYLLLIIISLLTVSCRKHEEEKTKYVDLKQLYKLNEAKISIPQGLAGTLVITEGDCMPVIGPNDNSTCGSYPVKREILIFDYTTEDDVQGSGPFYDAIETTKVGETISDENGFFQIEINPGKYSIFVLEKNKYYASVGNLQGGISPIIIKSDSVTINNFRIDYAVY